MSDVSIPQRAMVIVAHPDDAEFTMAGTVALWARAGCAICYVLCTRGDRGSNDPQVTPWELARIREQEQRAAAAILGVQEVIFLDYPDGTLEPTLGLRRDLTREIRRFRPEVVLCADPTVRFYGDRYINHPDHRAAASAALDAVFPSAETRYIFPELLAAGLEPHRVKAVYIHGSPEPNVWIDIKPVLEIKARALAAHASQIGESPALKWVQEMAREEGRKRGLEAAEAYRRMVLHEDDGHEEEG
jgi:LmbE family N-acetylglucosaminyl deacetylase